MTEFQEFLLLLLMSMVIFSHDLKDKKVSFNIKTFKS